MSRAARWGAGELAHVRAGVQGAGAGLVGGGGGARLCVLTLACITPGNSITSECWGDGVGPAREERGRAEWRRVNAAALSPHPTASPWGPSALHLSSSCTPAVHARAKAATAEAGESTMAQPRGHCVLDGATALAIRVK